MSPGPGHYSPNVSPAKTQAPQYVIGTSSRLDFTSRKNARVEPGPGNYNPTDKYVKTNGQAWIIGTEP